LPWVVTGDVHYATPRERVVHDVLCALRHQQTLDEMGTRLRPNAEWHLRSPAAMYRRWRGQEAGLQQTLVIAERCAFRMSQLRPRLPRFPLPPGISEMEYLTRLVEQGADERWGHHRTAAQERQLRHELNVIERLGFAGYFLIVWDIVRFARREGILCQGRGSAANSAACYCLGITAVDPVRMELLFERFLSEERQEAPDIDIDFSHRERERVLQYVYDRYGREHAAMVCEQITYRGRSAVRDAARVLGFSTEQADALSGISDRFSARATADALRAGTAPGNVPDDTAGVPASPERSHMKRDAAKRALLAERLGQDMIRGTEATTRAREVRAESRRVRHHGPRDDQPHDRPLTAADRPRPGAAYEPYGSPHGRSSRNMHMPGGPAPGPAPATGRSDSPAAGGGMPDGIGARWRDPH